MTALRLPTSMTASFRRRFPSKRGQNIEAVIEVGALSAEGLEVGYGRTAVARGIDLTLEPGSVTVLLGPNGVGKTTLFRTLLGLLPPLGGRISVAGSDLSCLSRPEIARHLAYVPQAHAGAFAHTLVDLVVMGRTARLGAFASPGRADLAAAHEALEALGIGHLAERASDRVSGGQLQLALIARALAQRARVVVMDEPTASLDLGNRLRVLDVIRALAAQGLAVLVSTHEPEQAFALADRVAALGTGDDFAAGPVDSVLTGERLTRLYGVGLIVETTPSGRRVVVSGKVRAYRGRPTHPGHPAMNAMPPRPTALTAARPPFAGWLGATNDVTTTFLNAGRVPGLINMAGGLPAPETFPTTELAGFAKAAIEDHPVDTLAYGPIAGLPELRDAVAARFATPHLRLTRDNVIVTSGGMQGLDLIGRALLEPGSLVAAQAPTYLGALDAWRPSHPTYRSMVLDAEGFDPAAAMRGAQFAYTVPNFSNPTGRLVGMAMRHALVAAAHATGTWLVEDDPYGKLQYEGEPLPRLIALSGAASGTDAAYDGPVVSMGTLSKEVVPGLRVGWVVAAPAMIAALAAAKQGTDMCTSGLTQRVALAALEAGLVERGQPAVTALYRARRDALCAALAEHAAEWFTWEVPVGGMFVWAVARDPALDTDRLLRAGLAAGVCVAPSSVFDPQGTHRGAVRINFTLNPPERLAEGVRRLAAAVRSLTS